MNENYLSHAPRLRQRLKQELLPSERVLWAGTPDWRAKWAGLLRIFIFAFIWTAFSGTVFVFALGAAIGQVPFKLAGTPPTDWQAVSFALLTFPFVVVGIVLLWHVIHELRSGSRRVHAITDRRLLTVELARARPIDNRSRKFVDFVQSSERSDGSGTLIIAVGGDPDAEGDSRPETLTWPGVPSVALAQAMLDQRRSATATANWRAPVQSFVPAALAVLPRALAQAATRETRGEKIDWVGQPNAVRVAQWSMFAWIIAVPWLYFTVRWELAAVGLLIQELARAETKAPIVGLAVMSLWGIPFIAIGLGMLATPLSVYRKAQKTAYIITDRRILALRRHRGMIDVSTIEPPRIVSVSRQDYFGRGNFEIVLGKTTDSEGDVVNLSENLWQIKDADRVEQLIEALRKRDDRRAA